MFKILSVTTFLKMPKIKVIVVKIYKSIILLNYKTNGLLLLIILSFSAYLKI